MGYLPENNPLYPDMYVLEYLNYVAGIHKIRGKPRRKRIGELIELTGLGPERHKKIGALSKGYRQRVGLAQALLHEPESLIMDEPTSGLDPNQIVEIRNLIKDIGKEKTVMLSTHIMQEVEAICDRVIIINNGRIVADKPSDELKNIIVQAASQIVEVEFDQKADMDKIKALSGISHIKETGAMSYLVEGTQEADLRKTLFDFAVQNGMSVLSMQKKEEKIEDIFRQLTNP
jgi:ABC-2 type transport system ATP-binding protein